MCLTSLIRKCSFGNELQAVKYTYTEHNKTCSFVRLIQEYEIHISVIYLREFNRFLLTFLCVCE